VKRRHFLTSSTTALGLASTGIALSGSSAQANDTAKPALKKGDVILFQGDSITDAGRDRKTQAEPNNASGLGNGYPRIIAGDLLIDHRDLELKIYNRGISGHKVPDLDKRWETDTIELKPTVLSILIGVNDIWHKLNGKYDGTPETYRDGFTALLERTRKALPDVTIAICEPFVLRCGAVKDNWFPEFDERKAFAKEVAQAAGTIWVPFQEAFDDAVAAGTTPNFWAGDGVHPSIAGHALMAKTWRKAVGI
jgi:lysophospholipase L1-like esterase